MCATRSRPSSGQGAADSPAQLAVALLKEHRSRVVGLNSAATKPLARARAERDALAGAVAEAELQRDAVDELAAERDSAREAAAAAARRVHALERAAAHVQARELPPADRVRRRAQQAARAAAEVAEREAAYAGFAPSDEIGPLRHRLRDLEAERDRRSGERVLDTQRLGEVERERTALAARAGALAPNRGATARAPRSRRSPRRRHADTTAASVSSVSALSQASPQLWPSPSGSRSCPSWPPSPAPPC